MGSYTAEEHLEMYGGLPERGECIPDLDALIEQAEDELRNPPVAPSDPEQREAA